MKKIIPMMALLGAFLLQTSCDIGGDTPAFGVGAVEASDTGIISRTHFTLRFSKWDLEVFDANTGAFTAKSTDIVIHAGDNEGRAVIGRVIQIRTAWGDKNLECTTDSSGDCSVTWNTDADSELAPDTNCVRVVAYTTGEEAYIEKNINDTTLDDLDAGSTEGNTSPFLFGFWDMREPYLDHNHNGTYELASDFNVDINGNGVNDVADGNFNGENCSATGGQCPTNRATSTIIWVGSYIDLLDEGKITPATDPVTPNTCQ